MYRISRRMMSIKSSSRQRGIALVLVLWVLTLLTVIALGLTTTQRTETALTRNQIEGARFRASADAAINLVVLDLLSSPLDLAPDVRPWVPDGIPRPVYFDGQRLEVTLFNEASRLDLNQATRDQLVVLMNSALGDTGENQPLVEAIADAIVDWRDADDLTQLNGAEDGDYDAAGLPYGAADVPFRSVEELRLVLGMTPALYERIADDLTVETGGRVDETFASAAVLAAVQGLTLENAQALVEQRNQPAIEGAEQSQYVQRGGPLYRLRVTLAQGPLRQTMEVLLSLEPGNLPPFEIKWRRYGLMSTASASDAVPDE